MPEIVIEKLAVTVDRLINRIDRRQPLPGYRIDNGNFGMIENWIREICPIGGDLWQDRHRRHERNNGRCGKSRQLYRRYSLGSDMGRPHQRSGANSDRDRGNG